MERRRLINVALGREPADAIVAGGQVLSVHTGEVLRADAAIVGTTLTGNSALDVLRKLRSQVADLPVILLTKINVAEQAVAAFKLGAQDYIQTSGDYLSQVVFSLSHGLSRAHLTRQNAELSRELAAINRSLEALVETRTQELHALSMRILRVQEDERREVARELHDQIGQLLTAIKLQIESTAQEAPPPLEAKLRDALNLAGELLSRTRNLTLQLRPQLLDDLGLQAAMEWHFQVFERQTGIAVAGEFSLPAGRLPSELETTIFRVVQEALTNVARHSGSGTADVTVVAEDAAILVEIADRGRGFDLAVEQAAHKSLGLAGMAERVKLAGGMLDIVSSPGKGTRVHASIPLPIPGAAP